MDNGTILGLLRASAKNSNPASAGTYLAALPPQRHLRFATLSNLRPRKRSSKLLVVCSQHSLSIPPRPVQCHPEKQLHESAKHSWNVILSEVIQLLYLIVLIVDNLATFGCAGIVQAKCVNFSQFPTLDKKLRIRRQREFPSDESRLRAFFLAEAPQASLYLQCRPVRRCNPSRSTGQTAQRLCR
jgi:uncharacterized integral membrane protein